MTALHSSSRQKPAGESQPAEPLLRVERSALALLPRQALPGAFDWWYADARDAEGNGLVFICASRLPFFPSDEPALNLALYRRGKPALWLLEQHPRAALQTRLVSSGFELGLGSSELRLLQSGGSVRLEARLDLAVPGDRRRLTGRISAQGASLLVDAPEQVGPHRWVPVAPVAQVEAHLNLGREPFFALEAPGYLDRNLGDAPLSQLGLRRWHWGRARQGDTARVWYSLEGAVGGSESHLLEVQGRRVQISRQGAGKGVHEADPLPGARGFPSGCLVDEGAPVERGPFYSRSFGSVGGMPSISERCEVARIGRPLYAPLVRMKLHRPAARNSLWAPLFCGPREGRLARLLRLGGI